MPSSDVVVVGAGLAGLTAGIALADAGATVDLVARGNATTHWMPGGFDIAAPRGAASSADGVARLAAIGGHPYATVADDVADGLALIRRVAAAEGLEYRGELADPLRPVPTAIGATRLAAILPDAQAAALEPWASGERLIVCGIAGFKDFWPGPMAASLSRPRVWPPAGGAGAPSTVQGFDVMLPGHPGRRNVNALELARSFDDKAWRRRALDAIGRAVDRAGRGPARVAVPAVIGLADHREAFDDAMRTLPFPVFEVPLVPPSIPGLRLYDALRAALRRRGGRLSVGEPVVRVEIEESRISRVIVAAAVRERRFTTRALILATGGIAGGGLVGRADGRLEEVVLGLPVEAPSWSDWLAPDPFASAGHPLERAGIRTDPQLRPLAADGPARFANVAIAGSLLAGQRYLAERCGDGVAIASGWRAAETARAAAAEGTSRGAGSGGSAAARRKARPAGVGSQS
jgi:glycerol-3-phosphate dehydrogenase subunit B